MFTLTGRQIPAFCSALLGSLFMLIMFLLPLHQGVATRTVKASPDGPEPAAHSSVEQVAEEWNRSALAMMTALTETPWVSGGPYGSSIRDLAISPAYTEDQTVFAATWGSGVFQLLSCSGEWEPRSQGLGTLLMNALAISPAFSDDATLFAAECGGGVYTSTDGGMTWMTATQGLPLDHSVYALAVSPAYDNDRTVYAGVNNWGAYRSQDGAQSWLPITTGLEGVSSVMEFEIAPTFEVTGVVYALSENRDLYRTDDGANWIELTALPGGRDAWSMELSPDGATLFVGTDEGVITSTDKGVSWHVTDGGIGSAGVNDIAISPDFAADQTLWACANHDAYRSTDAGLNWAPVVTGTGDGFYCGVLGISPGFSSDDTVFAGNVGGSGGVYRSLNGGAEWRRCSSGMTWNVLTLVSSPDYRNDRAVFAGLNGGGVFSSSNGGASWSPANSGYPLGADAVAIALSPQYKEDGTLFAGGYGTGIYRSEDRGQTWGQVGLEDVYPVIEMAIAPGGPLTESLILVGTEGKGVYRSKDGGTSWSVITQGLVISRANEIAFSPAYTDDYTIFVGSENYGLFRSQDAGVDWTHVVTGLEGDEVQALGISPDFASDGTLLVGTCQGLFRSQNGGDSWVQLPFSGTCYATEIAFSPYYADDQTIWVATTQWTVESEGGIFISENGGDSWRQVNEGLPQLEHYALATADRGGTDYDVFVGTHTWSVWQRYPDVDLLIRARGTVAGGEWPRMQVIVNDEPIADWAVDTLEYTLWITQANLTGQDQIDVWYSNDAWVDDEDRNLYVDHVRVKGTTVEPENTSLVVFDQQDTSSIDLEAFDGLLVRDGQTTLYDSGTLRFSVGIGGVPIQPPQALPIRKVMSDTWINDDARPSWAYQWDVAIAGNASGDAVIAWRDNRNERNDIYAQRLVTTGTLGNNFRVNDNAEWGDQIHPDVLVNDDGSFIIVWADGYPVANGGHQIAGQRYDSSGIAVGGNFTVTEDLNCYVYPSVAGPGDGSLVLAWVNNGNGDIWGQRYDTAGIPLGDTFQINDSPDTDAWRRHAEVAAAADGSFLVVWQDPRNGVLDIYGQWYDAVGNTIGTNFKINDDAGTAEQVTPDVDVDGSGNYVVTWRDRRDGNEDIYAQRYDVDRNPVGGNFRINDDNTIARQHAPRVSASDLGDFIVTWWDRRSIEPDIYAQYFDGDGNPVGSNFKIDDSPGHQEYCPDVAMGGSEEAWFAWYGNEDDYLDIYTNHWDSAETCTVTSTTDSGTGTLRWCLSRSEPFEYIDFDPTVFSSTLPTTITLLSELPHIVTDGLTIDASNAGVILDGSQLTSGEDGLFVYGSDHVTVRGLQIVGFPGDGIELRDGTAHAIIGGSRSIGSDPLGQGNMVSGNGGYGVRLSNVTSNTVVGNLIGTDIGGNSVMSNAECGISIQLGSSGNTIGGVATGERNIISGNGGNGISTYDSGTTNNVIVNNYIGTNISGTVALPNSFDGVGFWQGPTSNIVGGSATNAGNLISGNEGSGVSIGGTGTASNTVSNNYIGTDVSGTQSLTNTLYGIELHNGATNNLVESNLVSGNGNYGVFLSSVTSNTVRSNLIGTDYAGSVALGNAGSGIVVCSSAENWIEGNLISGNSDNGIEIRKTGATSNTVVGNYIGTNISGTAALSNGQSGISIFLGASNNVVGGSTPEERNLISGNSLSGTTLYGTGTSDNRVIGNYIGTDAAGQMAIPNGGSGVAISADASDNVVGGENVTEGNLISGNLNGVSMFDSGSMRNRIVGNYIGTNVNGTRALSNTEVGVTLWDETSGNLIADNLISGNGKEGICLTNVTSNTVRSNYIGTDDSGMVALGNMKAGINVRNGSTRNQIEGNLISGNSDSGIQIQGTETMSNAVAGNYIGIDMYGGIDIPNSLHGVVITDSAQKSWIGPGNTIAFNGMNGVYVHGSDTLGHTITTNSIFDNIGEGILLADGGNGGIISPTILTATPTWIAGTGPAGAIIEVFSDSEDEGRVYEGSATSAGDGQWTRSKAGGFIGPCLTATATDAEGNTSEFSEPVCITVPYTSTWTVMAYLNGDNDLDGWIATLFNRLELAKASDSSLVIRALWDRSGNGDTVLYQVQPDKHPYALGNYVEGETKWTQGELDMGDPTTLQSFILSTTQDLPATYYLLAIVNHGGGWSPELYDPQRRSDRHAGGASGFSWDFTDDYSYLSTQDMGGIFSHPQVINNPIDVVFYDACLMGMLEEAYEIRGGARYFVASQNETWTTFPYHDYLVGIEGRAPLAQVARMVDTYHLSLAGYPRTMAALDLQRSGAMSTALDNLTVQLFEAVPTHTAQIEQVFLATQKLDYNYDLVISDTEGYVDLGDFSNRLINEFPGTEIANAATALLDILDGFTNPMVIYERHGSGFAGWGGPYVDLTGVTGLSVYLPLGNDPEDLDLPFYVNSQLALTNDTLWDEFIFHTLGEPYPQPPVPSPGGRGGIPRPLTIPSQAFLPIVIRDQ
jgi:parallel beta-helix repeat protein